MIAVGSSRGLGSFVYLRSPGPGYVPLVWYNIHTINKHGIHQTPLGLRPRPHQGPPPLDPGWGTLVGTLIAVARRVTPEISSNRIAVATPSAALLGLRALFDQREGDRLGTEVR